MTKQRELTGYGTPLSDEWNTHPDITAMAGVVDWDPFSNAKSTVKTWFRGGLDTGVDGYDLANWPEVGVAFVNWPFSRSMQAAETLMLWLMKSEFGRSATVVHKADLTTRWYRRLTEGYNYRMLVPPKRINYISDRGTSSNFCSVVSCLGPDMTFQRNAEAAGWKVFR